MNNHKGLLIGIILVIMGVVLTPFIFPYNLISSGIGGLMVGIYLSKISIEK